MTHICVSELTIIGSDNGLSPGRCQAIIWTNAGILLIGPLGTNFNDILIEIHTIPFKKIHLKMSPEKWRLFCLGLNVLSQWQALTEDLVKSTILKTKYFFVFKCHWCLFSIIILTISQYCFRQWLVACSATSHCLNSMWRSSLMYMCRQTSVCVNFKYQLLPHTWVH